MLSSVNNDTESFESFSVNNPHNHISEVANGLDFYLFTSLLWIRTPSDHSCGEGDGSSSTPSGQLQPDLGLLPLHRDRLAAAAEALHWLDIHPLENSEKGLDALRSSIAVHLQCLPSMLPGQIERRKLRLMISKSGKVTVDSVVMDRPLLSACESSIEAFVPETLDLVDRPDDEQLRVQNEYIRHHKLCRVFVDSKSSRPSLFTTHKTSHRVQYDAARSRAKITASAPTKEEVLIYNENGEVMEASLCTVYLLRNGTWATPAASCGGNLGVTRRLALEKRLCRQDIIEVAKLVDGEKIWLSNGARGFFVGRVCLQSRAVPPETQAE